MRRGRVMIYLVVLVLIIAVGAALFLGRGFLTSASATPTPAVRMVNVVQAVQPIARGATITAEQLGSFEMPENKITAAIITDPNLVIGKLAKYPIEAGVPITSAVLVDEVGQLAQTGSEAAKLISPGMTAISIPTNRLNSVSFGINDGDIVDVIVTLLFVDVDASFQSLLPNITGQVEGTGVTEGALPSLTTNVTAAGSAGRVEIDPVLNQAFYILPSEVQRPRLVSQRILQSVQVLKVGTFSLSAKDRETDNKPTATPQPGEEQPVKAVERPDLITLIVTPQDAVTLTYLIYSGAQLTLTLRGIDDPNRIDTEAATLQFLLSQYAIPVPAKLPYGIVLKNEESVIPGLVLPILPNDVIITDSKK